MARTFDGEAPHPLVPPPDEGAAVHLYDPDLTFQLAADRRARLLDEVGRRRRLRRRRVDQAFPATPPDAA